MGSLPVFFVFINCFLCYNSNCSIYFLEKQMRKHYKILFLVLIAAGLITSSCGSKGSEVKKSGIKNTRQSLESFDNVTLSNEVKKGSADAAMMLGYRYDFGTEGVKQNFLKALRWYKKAEELGSTEAKVRLGYLYMRGLGVKKNQDTAYAYFKGASDKGDMTGKASLGLYYLKNTDLPDSKMNAYYNIREAADGGDPLGCYLMGTLYEKGIGVTADRTAAMSWYQKLTTAKNGMDTVPFYQQYPYQASYTALALLESQESNPDYEKAFKTMKKAAGSGYAPAQYYLGIFYEKGQGVSKSYSNAKKYYELAAKQKYAAAQNQLGCLYYNGLGVDIDYSEAVYYQKLAASQGYAPAEVNLGYMYENGYGVEKNLETARAYYQKAKDNNYDGAEEALTRIQQLIESQNS